MERGTVRITGDVHLMTAFDPKPTCWLALRDIDRKPAFGCLLPVHVRRVEARLLSGRQVPGLQVQQRAVVASEGAVAALVWITHPGAGWVYAVLVTKTPFDDESFLAAMMRVLLKWRVRRPANQNGMFIPKLMQKHRLEARCVLQRPLRITRIDDHSRFVLPIKLMQFDENDTSLFSNPRGVLGTDWIPNICAGWINLMFVTEITLQYKKLLAATVHMR